MPTLLKKPVRRITQSKLDGTFCGDRTKRIVICLVPGDGKDIPDLLELRPERTRRPERIAVVDVYRYALRCRINCQVLEKARAKKAKRQEQRATRRLDSAERRFRTKIKTN